MVQEIQMGEGRRIFKIVEQAARIIGKKILLFLTFLAFSDKCLSQQLSGERIKRRFQDSTEALTYAQEAWQKRTKDVTASIRAGEKALLIAETNDFKTILVNSLIYLSVTYRNIGDLVKSHEYCARALELSTLYNYTEGIAWANIGIASIYMEEGKYTEARPHYETALRLGKKTDVKRIIASAYYGISQIAKKEKKYDEALNLLQNTYKIRSLEEDASNISLSLSDIGEVHELKGEYALALSYYHKAQEYGKKKKSEPPYLFPNYLRLANFYIREKKLDSLLYYQALAEQAAEASNVERNKEKSLKLKAEAYAALGQYKEAYEHFYKFFHLHDSLHSRENQNRLLVLEELNEIKHKKREQNLLEREKSIAEQDLRKQQLIIIIFSVFVIVTGSLAYVYYRLHRRQLHINRSLKEQKDRNTEITAKLAQQKEELEHTNRIKDKLFSVISHDLRSPINSLTATLMLMKMDALSPEEWKKLSEQIVFDLKQSTFLLENLLSWAKSQMQGFQINKTEFVINDVVSENVDLISGQAKQKSIELSIEEELPLRVFADIDSARLVLRNLLTNAVKFTNPNGKVKVEIKKRENFAEISVIDNGVGFSENISDALFGKVITSTQGTGKEKGTGLGLLLSKEFVEKNGGKLTFKSEKDVGSVFTFTLPLAENQ
jgi:signal transduction histidine kinase